MNEGCSACGCGLPGACDRLYFPGFFWPGVIALALALLLLILLKRRRIIKISSRVLIVGWLVAAVTFAVIIYLNTESAGERVQRNAEQCQISGNPACEY